MKAGSKSFRTRSIIADHGGQQPSQSKRQHRRAGDDGVRAHAAQLGLHTAEATFFDLVFGVRSRGSMAAAHDSLMRELALTCPVGMFDALALVATQAFDVRWRELAQGCWWAGGWS